MASYSQIRLNKTDEIQEVIDYLKQYFKVLNESEILKIAISRIYQDCRMKGSDIVTDPTPKSLLQQASSSFEVNSSCTEPDNFSHPGKLTPFLTS